jgi:hypothetical protein
MVLASTLMLREALNLGATVKDGRNEAFFAEAAIGSGATALAGLGG